jgi:hypothetical protein
MEFLSEGLISWARATIVKGEKILSRGLKDKLLWRGDKLYRGLHPFGVRSPLFALSS